MTEEPKEPWERFEALGEAEVRKRLVNSQYGPENQNRAKEWLDSKNQERSSAASSEQRRIARQAKNAAIVAAIAAIIAAIVAIISLTLRLASGAS